MAHRVDVDELAAAQDVFLHRARVWHHSARGDEQCIPDGLRMSCILRGDSTLAEGVAEVGRGRAQTRAVGILGAGLWACGAEGLVPASARQALAVLGRRGRSTTQDMYMSCEINFSGRVLTVISK